MKGKSYIGKFLVLILGLALGWFIFMVNQPVTGERRDSDSDAAVFGANFDYGEEARRAASAAGVKMPTNAVDCFYGICGLKPIFEYIAFTVPPREVWPCIKLISGKQPSDPRTPFFRFQGPEQFGKERYGTVLFNLAGITTSNGIAWNIENHIQANCVADENSGRIFIIIF